MSLSCNPAQLKWKKSEQWQQLIPGNRIGVTEVEQILQILLTGLIKTAVPLCSIIVLCKINPFKV
jgi:hypothetical protein